MIVLQSIALIGYLILSVHSLNAMNFFSSLFGQDDAQKARELLKDLHLPYAMHVELSKQPSTNTSGFPDIVNRYTQTFQPQIVPGNDPDTYASITHGDGLAAYQQGKIVAKTPYHEVLRHELCSVGNSKDNWRLILKEEEGTFPPASNKIKIFNVNNSKSMLIDNKDTMFLDACSLEKTKFLLAGGALYVQKMMLNTTLHIGENDLLQKWYDIPHFDWPVFNPSANNLLGLGLGYRVLEKRGNEGHVAIWDVEHKKKLNFAHTQNKCAWYPTWTPDGKKLFVVDSYFTKYIYCLTLAEKREILFAHKNEFDIRPSNAVGDLIVFFSENKARIYNTCRHEFGADIAQAKIKSVQINPTDPKIIATISSKNCAITTWDENGKKKNDYMLDGCPAHIVWNRDGSYLAVTKIMEDRWETSFISKKDLLTKVDKE